MPYLRHYANGAVVGAVELTDSVTIGRASDNTIALDDGTVSSYHAEVQRLADGGYQIRDRDSTNGLFLSGERVRAHRFAAGDMVTVGTHDFEYLAELPDEFARTLKIKKSWIPGVYYTE